MISPTPSGRGGATYVKEVPMSRSLGETHRFFPPNASSFGNGGGVSQIVEAAGGAAAAHVGLKRGADTCFCGVLLPLLSRFELAAATQHTFCA